MTVNNNKAKNKRCMQALLAKINHSSDFFVFFVDEFHDNMNNNGILPCQCTLYLDICMPFLFSFRFLEITFVFLRDENNIF